MSARSHSASRPVAGLYSRLRRKLFRRRDISAARSDYDLQLKQFQQRTAALNQPELEHFYWYHAVDLGRGLITPGDYDLRPAWPEFHFPDDLRGLQVLDVGSATGYFAFEFAKRGADVVSVELPSFGDWDLLHGEREALLQGLMTCHHAATPQEAYHRHLDGPFRFCQERLGLSVRRCYSSIYDLTPEKLGQTGFDFIFAGDILLHLFSPLRALDVLASLCRGTLVVSTDLFHRGSSAPLLKFVGNQSRQTDSRTWWKFNAAGLEAMLQRVGFPQVRHVGAHSGIARRSWQVYHRDIFHASK